MVDFQFFNVSFLFLESIISLIRFPNQIRAPLPFRTLSNLFFFPLFAPNKNITIPLSLPFLSSRSNGFTKINDFRERRRRRKLVDGVVVVVVVVCGCRPRAYARTSLDSLSKLCP